MNFRERVIRRIVKGRKLYIVISLQLFVGLFILNGFLSINATIQDDYQEMLNASKEKEFHITIRAKREQIDESFSLITWGKQSVELNEYTNVPFTLDDIEDLQKAYENIDISAQTKVFIQYLGGEEDSYYTVIYDSNAKEATVSMVFLEMYNTANENNTVNPRDMPYLINEDLIKANFSDKECVLKIDNVSDENYLELPYYYYEGLYHPKNLINTNIMIQFRDTSEYTDVLSNIIIFLDTKYGEDYSYIVGSEFTHFLHATIEAKEQSELFSRIAILLIMIVVIGMASLFALLAQRRQKIYAIQIALGSTKKVVCGEMILEMFLIAAFGSVAGIVASGFYLNQGVDFIVTTKANIGISLLLLIVPIGIVVVATVPVILNMVRLTPMEILRTE